MNKGLRILLVFVLLTVPTISFAATEYNVYTWGYSDILHGILQAISEFLGSNGFASAFKIAASMGLLAVFGVLLSGKPVTGYDILLRVMMIMVISTVLTLHNARVNIIDVEEGVQGATNVKTIDNVPVYIGLPLNMLSSMEYNLREAFRTSLNKGLVAEGITSLNNMSVIKALNILQAGISFRMHDPNFAKTFNSFMENCVMPDIYTGYIDPISLTDSTYSFWHILKTATEQGARIGENYLDKTDGGATIASCKNLYDSLDSEFTSVAAANGEAGQQLAASLGIASSTSVMNILGAGSQLFLGLQTTSSDFLTNNMAMNMFNDAYTMAAQGLGVSQEGLAWGTAKAQETMKMTSIMQGINAKKYLPIAKGYLTVIFVAIIPIVILIGLAMGQVAKPISMVFGILLALALWGIGEQILDFIILLRSKGLLTQENGYTLASQAFVNQGILDTISLSLGMYWMIPTLAFSVATMSGYAATSMMSGISGIAGAGVSGAAGEAATGSATMGNIRTNTFSSNKFDAARDVAIGSSFKNQNSYAEGASATRSYLASDKEVNEADTSNRHTGSTWIKDTQTGKTYEVNGDFKQTGAGWSGSGMINEYDKNGNLIGSYDGKISGQGNMSDYQQNVINNGRGGKENALQATSVVSTNFDASHVKTENSKYENMETFNVGNSGSMSGNNIMVNGEKVSGKVSVNGDTATIEGTKNGMKYSATVENASISFGKNGMSVTGDIVKSNSEGGDSTKIDNSYNENNSVNFATGTGYQGLAQAAMGKTEDFKNIMTRLSDMKQSVLNGDMSAAEFQAEVRNFSGAYAQDMGRYLTKQEQDRWSVDAQTSADVQLQAQVDSGENLAGAIVEKTTGASMKGSISGRAGISNTNSDTTISAQNLIAKEMYDAIMQSSNSTDMINNASNLANHHSNTNLSDLENLSNSIDDTINNAKQTAGDIKDGIKKLF